MITIKKQFHYFLFHGTAEVRNYFDQYMHKDNMNEQFCYCGIEMGERNSWTQVPRRDEFNKKDWKIIQNGFAHFGVDIDNLEETA